MGGLSTAEIAQLGTPKLHGDGSASQFRYVPAALWPEVRAELLRRSLAANPRLDPDLTAYTPGETLALLRNPEVRGWHQAIRGFRVPPGYTHLVLVPCAKSKPWTDGCKSRYYRAYNRLRAEFPQLYWATISEPLGIVPMSKWHDFPQYDNPGLFRDDALRSGMFTTAWQCSVWGEKFIIPFDERARSRSLEILAEVVADFLARNRKLRCLAFVETEPRSTHAEILDLAIAINGRDVKRYSKRRLPRVDPYPYLREVLAGGLKSRLAPTLGELAV